MHGRFALLLLLLVACGSDRAATTLPTAHVMAPPRVPLSVRPRTIVTSEPATTFAPSQPPARAPTPASFATPLDQYRAWMEEARARHPYGESLDVMWRVMLCESSGNAGTIAGPYQGLFQYTSETWSGDWNPYRDSPILDPRAQIFATAKAWQDGRQSWWGCYSA